MMSATKGSINRASVVTAVTRAVEAEYSYTFEKRKEIDEHDKGNIDIVRQADPMDAQAGRQSPTPAILFEEGVFSSLLSECQQLSESPTRILPGTVVELLFEDDDQSSWVFLGGGEVASPIERKERERSIGAPRLQSLTIDDKHVLHITKCSDLAVAILNLEVGMDFTYRAEEGLLGGRILSIT